MRNVLLFLINPITAYLVMNNHIQPVCVEDVTNSLVIVASTIGFVATLIINLMHHKTANTNDLLTRIRNKLLIREKIKQ
jgi:hypothetical protein